MSKIENNKIIKVNNYQTSCSINTNNLYNTERQFLLIDYYNDQNLVKVIELNNGRGYLYEIPFIVKQDCLVTLLDKDLKTCQTIPYVANDEIQYFYIKTQTNYEENIFYLTAYTYSGSQTKKQLQFTFRGKKKEVI